LDSFAATFPDSFNMLVLDQGAFHKAKALRWPPHVAPVFLPSSSPARNPIERLGRELKDKLADIRGETIDA
jgi:transposase